MGSFLRVFIGFHVGRDVNIVSVGFLLGVLRLFFGFFFALLCGLFFTSLWRSSAWWWGTLQKAGINFKMADDNNEVKDELPRCSTLFLSKDGSQMQFYMMPCAMKTRLRPLIHVSFFEDLYKELNSSGFKFKVITRCVNAGIVYFYQLHLLLCSYSTCYFDEWYSFRMEVVNYLVKCQPTLSSEYNSSNEN